MASKIRNPPWSKDELILALDLYFRLGRRLVDENNSEVKKTGSILRNLPSNKPYKDYPRFRSDMAVAMKLSNFAAIDPKHGGTGLPNTARMDKVIWDNLSAKPQYLREIAEIIIQSSNSPLDESVLYDDIDDEDAEEGRAVLVKHMRYERNSRIVEKKKRDAEKANQLYCFVCGFDFHKKYGELGRGYIECHHIIPVSEYNGSRKTNQDDLVLVCSNCHRMIHKKGVLLEKEQLKSILVQDS